MPQRKIIYPGILNDPMEFQFAPATLLGGEPTSAQQAKCSANNFEQFFSRVEALFKHYGVEQSEPMTLVLKLAEVHVPGFSYTDPSKRGPGQPGKWKVEFKSLKLYADVKWLANQGHSDLDACRILSINEKYEERYGDETKENLHRRYLEALKIVDPAVQPMIENVQKEFGQKAFDDSCIAAFALREK
jgi:hypothetical protein